MDYTNNLESIAWINAHFNLFCVYYYGKIQLFQVLISSQILLKDHPANTKGVPGLPSINELETACNDYKLLLKSLYEGFKEFCNDEGLNSDDLIEWFCAEEKCTEVNIYVNSLGTERCNEYVNDFKDQFMRLWERNS
jgi:hypothetical protein